MKETLSLSLFLCILTSRFKSINFFNNIKRRGSFLSLRTDNSCVTCLILKIVFPKKVEKKKSSPMKTVNICKI